MTRKDYVAIAAAIKDRVTIAQHIQGAAQRIGHYTELAREIAEVMARDNPRFDRARFLKACGVQS